MKTREIHSYHIHILCTHPIACADVWSPLAWPQKLHCSWRLCVAFLPEPNLIRPMCASKPIRSHKVCYDCPIVKTICHISHVHASVSTGSDTDKYSNVASSTGPAHTREPKSPKQMAARRNTTFSLGSIIECCNRQLLSQAACPPTRPTRVFR